MYVNMVKLRDKIRLRNENKELTSQSSTAVPNPQHGEETVQSTEPIWRQRFSSLVGDADVARGLSKR